MNGGAGDGASFQAFIAAQKVYGEQVQGLHALEAGLGIYMLEIVRERFGLALRPLVEAVHTFGDTVNRSMQAISEQLTLSVEMLGESLNNSNFADCKLETDKFAKAISPVRD